MVPEKVSSFLNGLIICFILLLQNKSDNELERRHTLEEQDLAYEEMLEADRWRNLERSNEAKKKMVCNKLRTVILLNPTIEKDIFVIKWVRGVGFYPRALIYFLC